MCSTSVARESIIQARALCGGDQFLTRIALYGADYLQRKTSVFQVRRDKSTCENTKEQNSKLTAHEPECKTYAKPLIYCIADTR